MNLVWLDLEMSGLDVLSNKIIEVAVIITDHKLNILAEGPDLVISQSEQHMAKMNKWCMDHHKASGLTHEVLASNITEYEAEVQIIEFIRQWVEKGESPMCGNSIGTDREFIKSYMPTLHDWFHYRNFDVSSLKMAHSWWSGSSSYKKNEAGQHRAKNDIVESIQEARFYMSKFYEKT